MSTAKNKIIPLGDRVLISPITKNDKTASGIIIPDTADKETPQQGTVVSAGEGKMSDDGKVIPINVKKGDIVVFSKYGPDEIKIDDKEYYIISESNILAVIK